MSAGLQWTESIAHASQIERYSVFRSDNLLPINPAFATSFVKLDDVEVERDAFGAISNSPYSYTDVGADFATNFYHYYVLAVPVQGPSIRSNIMPLATAPAAFVLTLDFDFINFEVELSWTASAVGLGTLVLSSYQVWRAVGGGEAELYATLANDVLAFTDDDIVADVLYTYFVRAVDNIGVFTNTNSESVTPINAVPVALVIGTGNLIARTLNGISFEQRSTPTAQSYTMSAIAFSRDQNRAVIVCAGTSGGAPRMIYSDDAGKTWQHGSPPAVLTWTAIARSDSVDKWVAFAAPSGGVAQVWTSQNGIDGWVLENTGARNTFNYTGSIWSEDVGLFVAVGSAGVFDHDGGLSSPTGSTWTVRTIDDGGFGHTTEVREFSGDIYAFGAGSSTLNRTTDGITWTGGNPVFGAKSGLSGLLDGSRHFMTRNTNAMTETSGGNPLLQANWNAFVDLGAVYSDVHVSQAFDQLVFALNGSASTVRVSSDLGLTFASSVDIGVPNTTRIDSELLIDS